MGVKMLEIVTRDMWGAIPCYSFQPCTRNSRHVLVMNTKTNECNSLSGCSESLLNLQNSHIQTESLDDIRFNFIIAQDGTVYEGRGWSVQPGLPSSHATINPNCLLIGYVGEYSATDTPLEMTDAAARIVDYGLKNGFIEELFYYLDARKTQ